MNLQHFWLETAGDADAVRVPADRGSARGWPNADTAEALSAAEARFADATQRLQRRKKSAPKTYYGVNPAAEEILHDIASASTVLDAVITRNHYGSVVLNAARALFMDVDMFWPSWAFRSIHAFRRRRQKPWKTMLDDLRIVLQSETGDGFRIYRTAAGFRILATSREFEPGSARSNRLMQAVGADAAFVQLCRIQNTFRARLTPKPWRCGSKLPPNSFPRASADAQQRFTQWLSRYQGACGDKATCQYLEHVGPKDTHPRITPIIELHDRETKAFQSLQLA